MQYLSSSLLKLDQSMSFCVVNNIKIIYYKERFFLVLAKRSRVRFYLEFLNVLTRFFSFNNFFY